MKYLTILIAALCAALPASAKENRGDAIPRMCYRSFWPQEKYNRQFAETGVKLVFIYPANTDCTLKLPYSNYPTIWTGPNQYNWDSLDRHIGDVLKWNPGAKLIVMIDLNTPKWWNDAHGGTDSFRKLSDALLSEDYRRDVTEYVRRFLEYTESKYKDDIVAYHLAAGLCCEWFDSIKGRTTPRKDAEFGRMMGCPGMVVPKDVHKTTHPLFYDPVKDADKLAYWKWHHKITGDAAIAFAEDARRVINDRVPIGLFFGYMMAHGKDKLLQWGHLEYDRVFQSPAFGAVSAPAVYHHRGMGGTSGFQFCPDSILANGNILWQEIDHVTHVLKDTKKQGARQRSGGGKRLDFNTLEQTIVGLRREFALGMISGSHIWWFDMFGSWFDSPEVMAEIKHFNELAEQYADTGPDKAAEVAYFADAESMYYVNGHCPLGDMVLRQTQFNLFRSGVPWRCYSLPDLEHVDLSQFKVIILPNLFVLTPEKRELLEKTVLRDGKTVVTLFAPGIITNNKYDVTNIGKFTGIPVQRLRKPEESQKATYAKRDGWTSVFLGRPLATPELWRYIFRKAGVHIYNTDDEAFYANEEFVAIHTAKGGERTIRLPRPCRVTEVFENRVVSEKPVTEFTDTLPAPGDADVSSGAGGYEQKGRHFSLAGAGRRYRTNDRRFQDRSPIPQLDCPPKYFHPEGTGSGPRRTGGTGIRQSENYTVLAESGRDVGLSDAEVRLQLPDRRKQVRRRPGETPRNMGLGDGKQRPYGRLPEGVRKSQRRRDALYSSVRAGRLGWQTGRYDGRLESDLQERRQACKGSLP